MRCVSYMRRDSFWRDERSDYHKPSRYKKGEYGYYDLDGDLIAQQREHIRSYAEELGWEVEEEYIDTDGTEEFERLKKDCFSRKFDRLITDSFFRFGDDIGEARITLRHIFIPVGIQVAIAQDKFCSILSSKKGIDLYFHGRQTAYTKEGHILDGRNDGGKGDTSGYGESPKAADGSSGKTETKFRSMSILGERIHDGDTGEILRLSKGPYGKIFYRDSDSLCNKWQIGCPAVLYDDIIEIIKEALSRERTAAEWAKEHVYSDYAREKKEELIAPLRAKAKQLLEETDTLLAGARHSGDKQCDTEFCDTAQHDGNPLSRVDEEFSRVMENVKLIEMAYSLSSHWIRKFEGIDIPAKLKNTYIRLYISDVKVFGMGKGKEYRVQVFVRHDEFRSILPGEWLPELTFSIRDAAAAGVGSGGNEDTHGKSH